MDDDLIGQQLGGFTILSLLGKGGMASVYRARQQSLQREVALKVIRRIPGDSQDLVARFQREKQAMQRLEHPNILPIYDYASNSEYLWIAMRLVDGGSLDDELGKVHPLPTVVPWLRQLAGALDFAHAQNVVHRDLKPGNVLRDRNQQFYLGDFGIAKMLEQEGLTMPGTTIGTPEYMSPEQVLARPLTGQSDQYALGILAYQLVTGTLPFQGQLMDVLQRHVAEPPVSPLKHNPGLPPAAAQAILKALAKEPSERFPTASDFVEALAACCESAPSGRLPVPASPARSQVPRRKLLLGLALLPLIAGLGWWLGRNRHSGELVFEVGGEVQLRAADGAIRSLGPGQNPQFIDDGRILARKGKQLVELGKKPRVLGGLPPGVDFAVAPDGKSLALVRDKKLLLQALPDGKPGLLCQEQDAIRQPRYSAQGTSLLYLSGSTLGLLELKSGKQVRLRKPGVTAAAWSKDGQRLVLLREKQLVVVDIDSGDEKALQFPKELGAVWDPAWQPHPLLTFGCGQGLYQVQPDGGGLQRLVEPPQAGVRLRNPAWSD